MNKKLRSIILNKTVVNEIPLEDSMSNKPSIKVWVTPTSSKFKRDYSFYDALGETFARNKSDIKGSNIFEYSRQLNNDLEREIDYYPPEKLKIPIKQMHPNEFLKRACSPVKVDRSKFKFWSTTSHNYTRENSTASNTETLKFPYSILKPVKVVNARTFSKSHGKKTAFNNIFK